jgi:hypothetical protein
MAVFSPNATQIGKKETQDFDSSPVTVHAPSTSFSYCADSSSWDCLLASECKSKAIAGGNRTNKLSPSSTSRTINRNSLANDTIIGSDDQLFSSQLMGVGPNNVLASYASSLWIEFYCQHSSFCSSTSRRLGNEDALHFACRLPRARELKSRGKVLQQVFF